MEKPSWLSTGGTGLDGATVKTTARAWQMLVGERGSWSRPATSCFLDYVAINYALARDGASTTPSLILKGICQRFGRKVLMRRS